MKRFIKLRRELDDLEEELWLQEMHSDSVAQDSVRVKQLRRSIRKLREKMESL